MLAKHLPYRHASVWLINNYSFFSRRLHKKKIKKNLHILCFLLRYFKCFNYNNSKKRLFFLNLLFNSITSCILLLLLNKKIYIKRIKTNYNIFLGKLIHLQSILFLQLTKYKNIYLKYNKKLFHSRLLLFQLYAKIITFSLKKAIFITTDNKIIIKYFALHNRNLSAQFLVNYISIKLGQYFTLNSILNPILRRFKRPGTLDGFRFIISGRLTRKERAAYIVRSYKAMPLSNPKIRIDFAYDFKIMRFGVVGIKVYLLTTKVIPYYYYFEFKNTL